MYILNTHTHFKCSLFFPAVLFFFGGGRGQVFILVKFCTIRNIRFEKKNET